MDLNENSHTYAHIHTHTHSHTYTYAHILIYIYSIGLLKRAKKGSKYTCLHPIRITHYTLVGLP